MIRKATTVPAKAPPKKKKRPMMKLIISHKHGEISNEPSQVQAPAPTDGADIGAGGTQQVHPPAAAMNPAMADGRSINSSQGPDTNVSRISGGAKS